MKKRILFIIPDLRYGGTNSSLSNLYDAINKDFDIYVYALYNKPIGNYSFRDRVINSSKIIYYCYSYCSDLSGLDKLFAIIVKCLMYFLLFFRVDLKIHLQKKEVRRICQKQNYDLIIGFQEGTATRFASRFENHKKMAWIHCDYAQYHSIVGQDEKPLYSQFDKIVCVSKYTLSTFKNIYPSLEDKVVSIYNLFDRKRVAELSRVPIDDIRFDTSVYSILSVGRIDAVKRFSAIPGIAKKLVEKGMFFKWYIIGNVVNEEEYHRLKQGIIDFNLDGIVILLGERSNPYPYFAKSDLFVTTSFSEACPIVFLEAQTFSIPIVSTDFGSSYEFITNGINGYVSSLDNIYQSIIDVMTGRLQYHSVDMIDNKIIIDLINKEFNSVI